MHSSSVFWLLTLASTTFYSMTVATPAAWPPVHSSSGAQSNPDSSFGRHTSNTSHSETFCLTDADAQIIVDGFVNMLENTMENFNSTLAQPLFADDFTDYSDSINYPKQTPLSEVSFATKQDFIDGQGLSRRSRASIPSTCSTRVTVLHGADRGITPIVDQGY